MKHACLAFLAATVSGCTSMPESDPFAGTYRFMDPKEGGYVVVTRVDEGKWEVTLSPDGKSPPQRYPSPNSPPMTAVSAKDFSWFDPASPNGRINCLVWAAGRTKYPFICRVPVGTSYRPLESIAREKRFESKTGYVFVVISVAGVIPLDVQRSQR